MNISNVKIAILPLRAEREFKGGGGRCVEKAYFRQHLRTVSSQRYRSTSAKVCLSGC